MRCNPGELAQGAQSGAKGGERGGRQSGPRSRSRSGRGGGAQRGRGAEGRTERSSGDGDGGCGGAAWQTLIPSTERNHSPRAAAPLLLDASIAAALTGPPGPALASVFPRGESLPCDQVSDHLCPAIGIKF